MTNRQSIVSHEKPQAENQHVDPLIASILNNWKQSIRPPEVDYMVELGKVAQLYIKNGGNN